MRVLAALIADTVEEARARWLFWGLFGLSTLLILLFLFVLKIDVVQGAISLSAFGGTARNVDLHRFVMNSYSFISVFLYVWGTFLAIFASSGLIPSVLEPGRIALLLSKPVARHTLLLGRFAGNLLIVALNHTYLIGSIYLILGIKTHLWHTPFLLAIPESVFLFTVMLTVVILVGVVSESAALSTMVPVALMLVSALLAQRNLAMRLLSSEWSRTLWDWLYWILPKTWDLGAAVRQIMIEDRTADWWTPVWTSALFGCVVLASSLRIFEKRDF